jgi:hypothetical protein
MINRKWQRVASGPFVKFSALIKQSQERPAFGHTECQSKLKRRTTSAAPRRNAPGGSIRGALQGIVPKIPLAHGLRLSDIHFVI